MAKSPLDLSKQLSNPTDYNMSANRNKDYIEYVNTDFIDKFKEYDREKDYPYEKGYDDELKEHIKQYGIEEPLIMGFNPKTGYTRLIEGNHRLMLAKQLGLKELPVRMLRRTNLEEDKTGVHGGAFIDETKAPIRESIIKARPRYKEFYDYVPYDEDMKPSDWFSDKDIIKPYIRTESAKIDYESPDRWYNWRGNH